LVLTWTDVAMFCGSGKACYYVLGSDMV
jgi:hypothetical protein